MATKTKVAAIAGAAAAAAAAAVAAARHWARREPTGPAATGTARPVPARREPPTETAGPATTGGHDGHMDQGGRGNDGGHVPTPDPAHAPGHRHLRLPERIRRQAPPATVLQRPFAKHRHGLRHPGRG